MKRIYWLLIAAVPMLLWWLSQGGSSQEAQPSSPSKPDAEKPASAPETTPEAVKDLPTSSNGTFPKAPPAEAPAPQAPAPVEVPAPAEAKAPGEAEAPAAPPEPPEAAAPEAAAPVAVEVAPAPPAAPAEMIEELAETAPPTTPQIEAPAAPAEGEPIQVFDSKDRALDCQLLDITGGQALVRCPESLPDKEKARLVLPYGSEAITVNGQLVGVEDGVSRFKIMTMKAGQKKRFEEYLSQRLGL